MTKKPGGKIAIHHHMQEIRIDNEQQTHPRVPGASTTTSTSSSSSATASASPRIRQRTLNCYKCNKPENKSYSDDETLKNATLLQQNLVARSRIISDEAAARQALVFEAVSTIEDFHRSQIIRMEDAEIRQLISELQQLKQLSEEERDRQELEKFIFDRSSRDIVIKQVIPLLVENDVTKESFFLLSENDLREMGVKIGPRKQLLQIIEQEILRRSNLSARSDISSRPRSSVNDSAAGEIQEFSLRLMGRSLNPSSLDTLSTNGIRTLADFLAMDAIAMSKMGLSKDQRRELLQLIDMERNKERWERLKQVESENEELSQEASELEKTIEELKEKLHSYKK